MNTSAKNVVYYDEQKEMVNPSTFSTIVISRGALVGWMVHYVGKIFNFNQPPERKDVFVDIPFFDQKDISDEVLININDQDVKYPNTPQYQNLKTIPKEEMELFRKNGVSVKGQQNILRILKNDFNEKYEEYIFLERFSNIRAVEILAYFSLE